MLAGRPWQLSREEILDLDPLWVGEVLFHRRDEHGGLVLPEAERGAGESLRDVARRQGCPEHRLSEWFLG